MNDAANNTVKMDRETLERLASIALSIGVDTARKRHDRYSRSATIPWDRLEDIRMACHEAGIDLWKLNRERRGDR